MPTPETMLILAKLPQYEVNAPNRTVAIERCALAEVPETRTLSRDYLYQHIIKGVTVELAAQKLRAAARAGVPMRASSAQSSPAPVSRPQLDVSGEPGRNRFEKLLIHVKRLHPLMSHDAAFTVACDMNRTHAVIG